MATGREGDSTHLATDEPDGLPPSRASRAVGASAGGGLFRYQETAEAEDQLEEEKAARPGLYRRYRCLGNAVELLGALAAATSFVLQRRGPRDDRGPPHGDRPPGHEKGLG